MLLLQEIFMEDTCSGARASAMPSQRLKPVLHMASHIDNEILK